MPAPIPTPVRQKVFERWKKGESVASLAVELQLSPRTVRHLVRRFAKRGQEAVTPDYAACATKKLPADSVAFQNALEMRRLHPTWGGGLIRVMLKEDNQDCPSERTLQRWFRSQQLSPAPAGRPPTRTVERAASPHDVWQMDAVDQLRLGSGQKVSWLRIVDECSGAVLQTVIFPPRLLEFGRTLPRARGVAPGFFAVGTAFVLPRRQWHSVGIQGRLANRSGLVVDRLWRGHGLESRTHAARQWCGRTVARHGQTLGRTAHVSGCRGIATTLE